MYKKEAIISRYSGALDGIQMIITMIEKDEDWVKIHNQINRVVKILEKSKSMLMNEYVNQLLHDTFKDTIEGRKLRAEINSLFYR